MTASLSALGRDRNPRDTAAAAIAPSHSAGADMKQCLRPQRSALSAHPVPIQANAMAHIRAVRASGRCQKFVDTPRASGSAHQKRTPIGRRTQSPALFDPTGAPLRGSVGSGSVTTAPTPFSSRQLNRRTGRRAVGTEHTTIACFGPQQGATSRALEEVDAGIHRHRLFEPCAAERADQFRGDDRHAHCRCCRHWESAAGWRLAAIACTLAAKTVASSHGNC